MYDVGASWLMTSLAPTPLWVSLVTTASALPIFLLALPSGALSDIFDRRKILLVTSGYMLIVSIVLGILTILEVITPSLLLMFTFALGAGTTMIRTPMIPTLSARSELPSALILSAVASNVARAVGPSLAGFVVTAVAPWAVFFLNSASFIGMILVLSRIPKHSGLGGEFQIHENITGAIRAQLRYVRYSHAPRILIVRVGLFVICGSAILSLLPLFAKYELGLNSTGFGFLLGSFGIGGVIGGLIVAPKLRQMTSIESLITWFTGLLALTVFAMAYMRDFPLLLVIMAVGGVAWIIIFSNFYVIGLKSTPRWIGARMISIYLLMIYGGLAIGSILWGFVASFFGIPMTLSLASIALATSILARKWYKTAAVNDLDLTPSMHWPLPQGADDLNPEYGPVLVQVEYLIDASKSFEFILAIGKLRKLRLRDGATNWGIFYDVENSNRFLEIYS